MKLIYLFQNIKERIRFKGLGKIKRQRTKKYNEMGCHSISIFLSTINTDGKSYAVRVWD
jgi:hypothetical protein